MSPQCQVMWVFTLQRNNWFLIRTAGFRLVDMQYSYKYTLLHPAQLDLCGNAFISTQTLECIFCSSQDGFFFFFLNVSILSGIRNHLDDMAPSWRERDLSRGTRLLSVGQRKEEGNTRWALDSDYCTVSGWERFSNSLEKSLQMNMEISCKEPGSEAFALQLSGWVQEFCNQQEMIFLGKQRQSDKSNGRILSSTDLLEISRWQQNSLVKTLNWKDLCTVPFVKNPFNSPWVFNLYSGYL